MEERLLKDNKNEIEMTQICIDDDRSPNEDNDKNNNKSEDGRCRTNSLPLLRSMAESSNNLAVTSASMCELRHRSCPRCQAPMPPAFLDFQSFRCAKCSFKSEYYCVRCDAVIVRDVHANEDDKDSMVCAQCATTVGGWSELIYYTFSYDWTHVHQCPQCPAQIDGLKYRCINCHTLMICPEDDTPAQCVACKSDLNGLRPYYMFLHDRQWLDASAWINAARRIMCSP